VGGCREAGAGKSTLVKALTHDSDILAVSATGLGTVRVIQALFGKTLMVAGIASVDYMFTFR
jgi:hypothetical protein